MGLQFEHGWALLFAIPALAAVYAMARRTARIGGLRKKAAVALRTAVIILVVLALAGAQWYTVIERRAVIFVVDRSDSMTDVSALASWLGKAGAAKGPRDVAGVVSVGLDAAAEKIADESGFDRIAFDSPLNTRFTRLDAGLRLAASMLPEDASQRIVLVSDGAENVGDVLGEGKLLQMRGIPVDVLAVPRPTVRDAAIDRLRLPEQLRLAEAYALEVRIVSTFATEGELKIYEDNREISSQRVVLERGENRFALHGVAKEQGLHRYRAELFADGDEQPANNAAYAFSRVSGPPKVLIVEPFEGAAKNVAAAFDAGMILYDRMTPELLPSELADYVAYESIVLDNVPATRLSETRMNMIEQAVRDFGVGLVMTGGEDSFGLGGYFKTPIERALPVYMDLRGKRQMPTLALMLVIDKSSSMSGDKILLAQEAAARTVEQLREQDTIGVVAFDSDPWWVVKPQQLRNPEGIIRDIRSIRADGGTDIYPAVAEAYEKLLQVDAQRKHIILLTDGHSATEQSYEALTGDMVANNVTLSTVAIGDGADRQLLERLAHMAKGRYYFTNDHSTVPAIFSRETVLVSRTYVVDVPFVPVYGQAPDWQPLFSGGIPKVNAYVATTAKETAEIALMSPEPDPLLARWQYGAGRAVAWTSDTAGKWAGDWLKWDRFADVFNQWVKWTFPQFQSAPYEVESRLEGNEVVLDVKSGTAQYEGELVAVVTGENLQPNTVELTPSVPGEYTGRLPISEPGVYMVNIAPADGTNPGGSAESPQKGGGVTTGIVVPYSPEYRIEADDGSETLKKLAELTGGRVLSLDQPEQVFEGKVEPRRRVNDISRPLLIAALLLWIADIAVRRLSIPRNWLNSIFSLRRRAVPQGSPVSATLERLRTRRPQEPERGATAVIPDVPMRPPAPPTEPAANVNKPVGEAPTVSGFSGSDAAAAKPADAGVRDADAAQEQPADREDRLNRLLAAKKRRSR